MRRPARTIIKRNETIKLIGQENFRMDKPRLIICSLAINILSLALPVMTLQVYDRIIANGSEATLNVLAIGVACAIVLESMLRLARAYVTSWAGASFEHKTSCAAIKHLLKADIENVERQSAGEYLNRVASISKLREFYSGYALMTLIDLPFVFLFIGLIAYTAHSLVLVPLMMLGIFILVASRSSKAIKEALTKRDAHDEARYDFILEALSGIHTIKSGAYESIFMRKHEMMQQRCSAANYKVAVAGGNAFNQGYIFTSLMVSAIVAFGAIKAAQGGLTMGTLIACVLLSSRIMQPVQRAMALWTRYQDFNLAKEHVDSLFTLPITVVPESNNEYGNAGILDLNNISYNYASNNLFRNISLKLNRGECISISSNAGTGKTTLLKLISGVYRPNAGTVKVDGVDPYHYKSEELLEHVGYLPTQGVIYRGSIYNNLTRFGKTPADKAFEIAELLGIDAEVAKLPNGYNTMLEGTTADNIPPGLKQRIAMARVLACKPRIILFDHADRALDKEGYNQVYRLLGKLKGKATMIIVSSDRNLLRLAEKEYVLEDGELRTSRKITEPKIYNIHREMPI